MNIYNKILLKVKNQDNKIDELSKKIDGKNIISKDNTNSDELLSLKNDIITLKDDIKMIKNQINDLVIISETIVKLNKGK